MVLTVSLLLAAACIVPAAAKLLGHPKMRASAARFGIAWKRYRLIGLAELAAAAGVLVGLSWRPLGVAAGVGLAPLLLGAIYYNLRARNGAAHLAPALYVLAIDAAYPQRPRPAGEGASPELGD